MLNIANSRLRNLQKKIDNAPKFRDQKHKENKRKGDVEERLQLTCEKMINYRRKIVR